jgi:hypothetical protein
MSHEAFGHGLEIVVHQRKQAEPGAEHERTFQSFEHRDDMYATGNTGPRSRGVLRYWGHGGDGIGSVISIGGVS